MVHWKVYLLVQLKALGAVLKLHLKVYFEIYVKMHSIWDLN